MSIITLKDVTFAVVKRKPEKLKKTLISIFPGYITNQLNDQLQVGLLAQFLQHCTSGTEVRARTLPRMNFFHTFILQHKSCTFIQQRFPLHLFTHQNQGVFLLSLVNQIQRNQLSTIKSYNKVTQFLNFGNSNLLLSFLFPAICLPPHT